MVEKSHFPSRKNKVKQKIISAGIAIAGFGALAHPGSAAINTTAIVEMISAMSEIFPSLGDMVVGIVPTILLLAVVGFVTGFFDKILDMVGRMIKF